MTLTRVVNVRYAPYDIYIARPGRWGNPFVIGRDGDRRTVIMKYAAWIVGRDDLMRELPTLRGRRYCKPLPCHGDILARLADGFPGRA